MANNANINPTAPQKLERHLGRIKTLQQAIKSVKTQERKDSLQAELDRRMAEVKAIQSSIEKVVGNG